MTIMIIRSVIIYIFVIFAVRLTGKRQIGELKPQELVITILISAVATIPLQDISIPMSNLLMPILVFVSLEIISSALSMKSVSFRNILQGKPVIIIKNGVLQQKQMKRLRYTADDLIDALRQQGVFDISAVENAVVETNGSLSVQQKAQYSPVTPQQLGINVSEVSMPIAIVMDGTLISEYFAQNVISENEANIFIAASEAEIDEIMLLTVDENAQTYMIKKEKDL